MGKVRVGVCALAAVLVLAGCTTGTEGHPAPADEPPLTSSVLGEPTSVDPCSLTGPAAFEGVGTARMPGMPTLDDCRVTVAVDGGHAYVWVGLLRDETLLPGDQEPLAEPGRGTTIERLGGTCDAALVLADGLALGAWAEPAFASRPDGDTLCRLTEAALQGAYQVLAGGRVRHWTPPVSSLAVLEACDVLSHDVVSTELGMASAAESPYPAGHRCRWGDPDGDPPLAELEFPVGVSPDAVGVPDGARGEQVSGRTTWLVPLTHPDMKACVAITEQGAFGLGTGTLEYAALRVIKGPRRDDDACAHARELARQAWAGLPPLA